MGGGYEVCSSSTNKLIHLKTRLPWKHPRKHLTSNYLWNSFPGKVSPGCRRGFRGHRIFSCGFSEVVFLHSEFPETLRDELGGGTTVLRGCCGRWGSATSPSMCRLSLPFDSPSAIDTDEIYRHHLAEIPNSTTLNNLPTLSPFFNRLPKGRSYNFDFIFGVFSNYELLTNQVGSRRR